MTAVISEKRFCACGLQLITLRQVITGRCEHCEVKHAMSLMDNSETLAEVNRRRGYAG